MNMNHRTLPSSLMWMYDPKQSIDLFLSGMYVFMCECACLCLCVCVTVYLGQGPLEAHFLGCLAEDHIGSDGGQGLTDPLTKTTFPGRRAHM